MVDDFGFEGMLGGGVEFVHDYGFVVDGEGSIEELYYSGF